MLSFKPTITTHATKHDCRYRVLLLNDRIHHFSQVASKITKVIPISFEESYEKTKQAHLAGSAVLIVCHAELAEFYHQRLKWEGLQSNIESDI